MRIESYVGMHRSTCLAWNDIARGVCYLACSSLFVIMSCVCVHVYVYITCACGSRAK